MVPAAPAAAAANLPAGLSAGCDPVKYGRHKSKRTKPDVQTSVKMIIITAVCVIAAVMTHSPLVIGLFDKEEVIIGVLHTQ